MKKQGERFRECREAVGLSRIQCGNIVGVSPQTIENIENETKMGSLNKAISSMGISLEFMATGKAPRWADGKTDAENESRLKAILHSPSKVVGVDPETYQRVVEERDRYLSEYSFLKQLLTDLSASYRQLAGKYSPLRKVHGR